MRPEELKERLEELKEADLETSWSKEELWASVEARLSKPKSRHRYLKRGVSTLPWAAVVLCAIGFYWWSNTSPAIQVETESFAVFSESADDFVAYAPLSEGKQLIYETCNKQLEICESPQFKNLYQELLQIEKEKVLLLSMVEQYGSDEIAIKALIQLENAESSITSKLISLIMA